MEKSVQGVFPIIGKLLFIGNCGLVVVISPQSNKIILSFNKFKDCVNERGKGGGRQQTIVEMFQNRK